MLHLQVLRVPDLALQNGKVVLAHCRDHVVWVVIDRVLFGPLPEALVDAAVVGPDGALVELEIVELQPW